MADDGSKQSANIWPMVKFQFQVKWDDTELVFQEVSGLDAEAQVVEYRGGNYKAYTNSKMPGLVKYSNITLKKGIFQKDTALWTYFTQIKMNTYKRSTIIINLLDETGAPAMTWTLINAFPTKITGTDLKADANEVAVESIEIAHEGMTVKSS